MREETTSRERLLRTFRREPVDRVPISTYEMTGCNPDSWYEQQPSYAGLLEFIRKSTDCMLGCWYDRPNLALKGLRTEENWEEGELLFTRVTLHTPKGDLTALYRRQEDVHTTWTIEHFLKNIEDLDKWLSIPYRPAEVNVERMRKAGERIGDDGIVVVETGDPILVIAELFSFQDFFG